MTIDTNSATWKAIEERCRDSIEQYRDRLENHQPDNFTAADRGAIKALRSILAMGEPAREPLPEDPSYEA